MCLTNFIWVGRQNCERIKSYVWYEQFQMLNLLFIIIAQIKNESDWPVAYLWTQPTKHKEQILKRTEGESLRISTSLFTFCSFKTKICSFTVCPPRLNISNMNEIGFFFYLMRQYPLNLVPFKRWWNSLCVVVNVNKKIHMEEGHAF